MNGSSLQVVTNRDLVGHLKAMALAHCAGSSPTEFSAGFLAALVVIATMYDVEPQFEADIAQLGRRNYKVVEVSK